MRLEFVLNGEATVLETRPDRKVVDLLREDLGITGTNLLIEATRRLDEWNMISGKIPSFDVVPTRVPLPGNDSIRLNRDDWRILLQMDGSSSIREMAKSLGMDRFEVPGSGG